MARIFIRVFTCLYFLGVSSLSHAIEADPLHCKIGEMLARADVVVIAKGTEHIIVPDIVTGHINNTNPFSLKGKSWLYSLQVLHVLAVSDNVQDTTIIATRNNETFRIQVIQSKEMNELIVPITKGNSYLLFLKKYDKANDYIKNYNLKTLEHMQLLDGSRSCFEYGKAFVWQRMIQRASFKTESMQDLTEAMAALCDLMKKGADTKSLLEKLNADKRYIFKYAAEQYQKIPEDKRARFVYTNSKLPVLIPNGPVYTEDDFAPKKK